MPSSTSSFYKQWLPALLLMVATFVIYLPALNGGFVWDDDTWTTDLTPYFQNLSGLWTIWSHPTTVAQYYPLTTTSFWLDYHLWKFWTLPYHIENVLLHGAATVMLWRLLLKLRLPGAWLAAALFAVHPVMAESVAWITERKNVLSIVFYFGALMAYGKFSPWRDEIKSTAEAQPESHRRWLYYCLAFILFVLALGAKTTAFSLPAVILLIAWWRRGRLRLKADILPTLPFFAAAFALCAVTAWVEKNFVGAQGDSFAITFPQRCIVAGHVFWFYLAKLVWPANLCFIYPRWEPDASVWWQWLYPATAVAVFPTLWLARKRFGRGPITAFFFYVGTLLPLLGFMNAFAMRYSFVWDHWVYLPSLGPLVLLAAAVTRLRKPGWVYGFPVIVLPLLGMLTWQEAGTFTSMEHLWLVTLERNPQCWMADSDLGSFYSSQRRPDEAEKYYRAALDLKPDFAEAHMNLGIALAEQGRMPEGLDQLRQAVQLNPNFAEGYCNLGNALMSERQTSEAIEDYQRAIQLKPGYFDAYDKLGIAQTMQGDYADATRAFEQAIQLRPNFAGGHYDYGLSLTMQNKWPDAIQQFERAVQINPNLLPAQINLGLALAHEGNKTDAIVHLQTALNVANAQGNQMMAQVARTRLLSLQAAPPPAPGP